MNIVNLLDIFTCICMFLIGILLYIKMYFIFRRFVYCLKNSSPVYINIKLEDFAFSWRKIRNPLVLIRPDISEAFRDEYRKLMSEYIVCNNFISLMPAIGCLLTLELSIATIGENNIGVNELCASLTPLILGLIWYIGLRIYEKVFIFGECMID